jgi:hypothetical protein
MKEFVFGLAPKPTNLLERPALVFSILMFTFVLLRVTWVAGLFRGSLLGNSFVTYNNTAGVARQPPHVTMEIQLEGVFYVVCPDAISRQLPVTSSSSERDTVEYSSVPGVD